MSAIRLTPEQTAAVNDRGGALLVSAAAGAGKTKVLVERLMGYLTAETDPADITDFLVITYTRAAAAELRSKILAEISSRIAEHPEYRRLRRQATLCLRASISTIHSFCAELIRENSHALDLPHELRVIDENEALIIKTETLDKVLESRYSAIDGDPDFLRLADFMTDSRSDRQLREAVLDAHARLQCHPRPEKWVEMQLEAFKLEDIDDIGETAWGAEIMAWARRRIEYLRASMSAGLDAMPDDPKFLKVYGANFREMINAYDAFLAALDRGWDEASARAGFKFNLKGSAKGYQEIKDIRDRCRAASEAVETVFASPSHELISDMRETYPAVSAFLRLLLEFDEAYAAEKKQRGVLDFSDQEHMCLRLLYDFDSGCPMRLAAAVSGRYREILVDEYQDINAVQEMIFSSISRSGKNMFMVGDVKQSIYRFRLADPTIFISKYDTFTNAADAEDGEPRKILLPMNFRSRKGILEAVNYVFANLMSKQIGEMDYTAEQHLAAGRGEDDFPEPAVEFDIIETGGRTGGNKRTLESDFIADRVKRLLDSGMEVPDGAGGMRPLRPGDVCILLRSMKNKAGTYAASLSERGIQAAFADTESFFETFEISVMLALLAVIDNPMQDVPLVTVLRSPIFAFTPDELAEIRAAGHGGDFYSALCARAESSEKCASFLERLKELRALAQDMTAEDLIFHIYDSTSFYAVAGAMEGGAARQANLMRLAEYAHTFERNGYRGLFGFVTYLRSMIENEKGPEASDAPAAGGVSIMSIHKSKGLEFPVVILADTAKTFNMMDAAKPVLFHSELGVGLRRRDMERRIQYPTIARDAVAMRMKLESLSEELRVLYVAMTRAKEKLIITAAINKAEDHIAKLLADAAAPVEPGVVEEKKCYADWLLLAALTRPEASALGVCPATAHTCELGARWDIRLCGTETSDEGAISAAPDGAQAESRAGTAGTGLTDDDVERLLGRMDMRYPFAGSEIIPAKLTATELKGRVFDAEIYDDARIDVPETPADEHRRPEFITGESRLTAAERGTALHAAMQYIDFAACAVMASVRREIERLRVSGYLTDQQAAAADPGKIWKFLSSPTGRRLLSAGELHREFKFSVLLPAREFLPWEGDDTILFQGAVDSWFEEDGGITVVDFKSDRVTDANFDARVDAYTPQILSYARALREITGMPVKSCVLYFFANGRAADVSEKLK